MARKRRNRQGQRDHSTIASGAAVRPVVSRPLLSDRRLFHPDAAPVLYSPRKSQRRIVEVVSAVQHPLNRNKALRSAKRSERSKFSFAVPRKVELCVRRKQRREVMFALRKRGKGSRAIRRRRNQWSGVSCR